MHLKRILMPLLLATLLAGAGLAAAADTRTGKESGAATSDGKRPDMSRMMQGGMMRGDGAAQRGDMRGDMSEGEGMMQGRMHGGMMDMMGMMNMMGECSRMMKSASMMPTLPPGNEKLQLQMQAEMMQKMGEILGSYAARLKDDAKAGAR